MRGALCVATRLYILYLAADESISGWEFLLLIPKSPHMVSSNGQFRCFLVRILIRKDNTENKVFKKESYTKETRKKGIKNKVVQIFVQFAGTFLRECPGNKFL